MNRDKRFPIWRWGFPTLFALAALVLGGCGDFDFDFASGSDSGGPKQGTASLSFTVSSAGAVVPLQALSAGLSVAIQVQAGVVIEEMRISIEEIEFEREDEDLETETEAEDDADDPEFEGPFQIDLLDATGILAQSLGEVEIPAGTYTGIEFDMHKSTELDPSDSLFDRSIFIAGTIDDGSNGPRPFVMWHDTDEEFFLTGPNGIVVEQGTPASALVVDFDLDDLLVGIDLVGAVFDTGLGIYDISPDSDDNHDLSHQLKDNLELAADFGEDEDHDGELDEDEDVEDDGEEDES